MRRLIILFILCITTTIIGLSKESNATTPVFNREEYRKLAKDYKYNTPKVFQPKAHKENKTDYSWVKYFAYLAVFAAIIFLIYQVVLYIYAPSNKRVTIKNPDFDFKADEPTIESDLEGLLKEALLKKNFKDAVRIYYLLAIKILNDTKAISYSIDKTNFEYVAELANHPGFMLFRELTLLFEKTWFGDLQIDEANLISYQSKYKALSQLTQSSKIQNDRHE
jgi:hypothetical protein